MDEVNVESRRWEDGKYSLTLRLRDDNSIQTIAIADFWSFSSSFPFWSYPKISTLPSSAEFKQRINRETQVIEYTYKPAIDGKTVVVEARHSNRISEKNPEELRLDCVDAMEWDAGYPFFRTLERKDSKGITIFKCEFVSTKSTDSKDKEIDKFEREAEL